MKSRFLVRLVVLSFVVAVLLASGRPIPAAVPENLARKATTWASSEHNGQYLSKFAVDGKIPPAGSSSADLSAAWCVLKASSGDRADFTFQWPRPVTVSQIVYFGRTSWFMNECWKDYEVYAGEPAEGDLPIARGTLQMIHGPQRVEFPKTTVAKITVKFLNSYGGPNPGAAEIMIFSDGPSSRELAELTKGSGYAPVPQADEVDRRQLGGLIRELIGTQGNRYAQGAEHLARLDALSDDSEQLAELQRDVLLCDVDRLVVIKRHEIEASHVYTYHYEGFRPGGGLYVVSARDGDAEPRELVATPTGQILDCDLSYDGEVILFSWRRRQDEGYHLWIIRVDGSDLRQITDGPWHDYNACWLPEGDIAFLTTRAPQFAYCWHAPVGILHRMSLDGSNLRQLSANYLNDFTPSVLEDGRIIYSRWEYVDRPAIPIQSLWTVNPDGTGLSGFFGNRVLSPGTFMEARSIPGTGKVLCTMTGHNGPTRGAIGVIDRALGVNAQEAIENITPDTPLPNVDQGNGNTDGSKLYSCPLPLDATRFLLSARGPVLVRTLDGGCVSTVLPAPGDGMQYFNAQPLRPRSRPPVVAPKVREEPAYATIYLQDVYNGLEPYVQRGEVVAIRVVRDMQKSVRIDPSLRAFGFQFPVISCGATYAGKDVLGEVPVEADGSACFCVPARTPLYFMALDGQGRAVQRMRSFTHLMPGEVQGCIGCHEHRRHASRPYLGAAYSRTPHEITPPEWGAGGFDYARVVQPVLDKYCAECHNPVDPPQGLDLSGGRTDYFNVSYDVLARENQGGRGTKYVNWIPTYNGQEWNILEVTPKTWGSPQSKLAEMLFTGHPDEQGKPRFQMDDAGRRRILAWIDLNVPYYGTSETAYPDHEGCRRILPGNLDKVLSAVAQRRCVECHQDAKIPRRVWTRITEPELNPFLIAPLAKSAGGSQKCGKAVFADRNDRDYQAILATFRPIAAMLEKTPRMDMPGAVPSCTVSRSCQ
ncbi:MAG: hypothetical protein JXB62_23435 [Pirellulales bacterium]|nr:hypothetical protein [Pirellulales bacterium]